jgi:hypothetical protein
MPLCFVLIIVELLNGCVSDRDVDVAGTLTRHGFCQTNVSCNSVGFFSADEGAPAPNSMMMSTREISSD